MLSRSLVWKGLLMFIWLSTLAGGFYWLLEYKNTPGATAEPPKRWPQASILSRDSRQPTLLLFLHPHCDCSYASLHELKDLLGEISVRPCIYVLFASPDSVEDTWHQTGLFEEAKTLKNVNVVVDRGDQERQRFRSWTSGQVLLYDANGELQYNGGITRARGVRGDNPGRHSIRQLLKGSQSEGPDSPVLGCPLCSRR